MCSQLFQALFNKLWRHSITLKAACLHFCHEVSDHFLTHQIFLEPSYCSFPDTTMNASTFICLIVVIDLVVMIFLIVLIDQVVMIVLSSV
jgi:hypothetical protein